MHMAYLGILLVAILISFIVVSVGGLALQLTGIESEVARFQALSAFSGTGFTTTEAERIVQHRTRRRIVTILIILGNAGLVTIIATMVATFTQVTGYGWFFARLGIIIISILVLYRLVIGSRFGNRFLQLVRKPIIKRILRDAPTAEEIFHAGKGWSVSLITIKEESKKAGLSLSELVGEEDLIILTLEAADDFISRPGVGEKINVGDRLLVYGRSESIKRLLA
jgi:ABC-type multidrug transport system fused ATPase/permease subunit